MKDKEALLALGQNLAKIGTSISEHRLSLNNFKVYYIHLVRLYNKYIELSSDFVNIEATIEDNYFDRLVIQTEIKAWEIYTNFKKNVKVKSPKDMVLFYRYYFIKNSDYRKKIDEIRELKKEIKDPNNIFNNKDKLGRFRIIGRLYDELLQEKIFTSQDALWAFVGVLLMIILYLFGIKS